MAGHSKWAKIKRKKAVTDVKRSRVSTKLLREVQVAARMAGSNLEGNPRLKAAVQAAKAMSVPSDNIERAIKRGAGDSEGANYEEIVYEGFAPGGVALLIKAVTDNRNRTVAEVRSSLVKRGASLAGANSVAHIFQEKGVIVVPKKLVDEEALLEMALEAGASDVVEQDDCWEVLTELACFGVVSQRLEALGQGVEAQLQMIPNVLTKISGSEAQALFDLIEALEDLDDVQTVNANFEIEDQELADLSE